MRIERFGPTSSVEDVKAYIDEWGFAVVEGRLSTATADDIHRDVMRYADRVVGLDIEFFGDGALKKVEGLAAKSAAVIDTMNDPFLVDLAEAYVGIDPLLNASGGFVLETGRRAQPLHHDGVLYKPFVPRNPGGPQSMLNFMYAITDFTAENGATRMVPGSHLWPEGRLPTEADEVIDVEMPKGSFAVWLGDTWHGAGQNLTTTPRIGCEIGFNCGWLRPHENYQLLIPPGFARDLPVQVQEILGYKAHRGMLGCIEQRSPMEIFGFEKKTSLRAVVREDDSGQAKAVDPRELEAIVRDYYAAGGKVLPAEAARLLKRLGQANEARDQTVDRANLDMLEVVAESEARALTAFLSATGLAEPIEALRAAKAA